MNTEGIKYTGSKKKIIPYIANLIGELKGVKNVLDGFSGSTRVSQAFAQWGYNTTANDTAEWSEVFATCYLKPAKEDRYYLPIIDHLNNLKGFDGWFTENYGADNQDIKQPFQRKNTQKLDAVRKEIDKLNLVWEDKCIILTALIQALDKVDSTLGHYASYLKEWSPRSYNNLILNLPRRFPLSSNNEVIRGDIFDTVFGKEYDLVYYDPPYGSNNEKMPPSRVRYTAYYHLWKTVILNDQPKLFGKSNRREDTRDTIAGSVFEEFRKDENGHYIALQALNKLIQSTNSRYVLLSYSSGGRATKEELLRIMKGAGKLLKVVEIDYNRNVMSSMRWTNEWINSEEKYKEYLFLIKK
ncbi:MAG: DNA adenine methylase [Paludibacteraceae bacterium]